MAEDSKQEENKGIFDDKNHLSKREFKSKIKKMPKDRLGKKNWHHRNELAEEVFEDSGSYISKHELRRKKRELKRKKKSADPKEREKIERHQDFLSRLEE